MITSPPFVCVIIAVLVLVCLPTLETKRHHRTKWAKQDSESAEDYLARLKELKQRPAIKDLDSLLERGGSESLADYRQRVDTVKQIYPRLPWSQVFYDTQRQIYKFNTGQYVSKNSPLRKKYFRRYFQKRGQSDKDFYERLLEQYEGEDEVKYEERIRVLKEVFPKADWAHVNYNMAAKQYVWEPKGEEDNEVVETTKSDSEEDKEQWNKRKGEGIVDVYKRVMRMKPGESFTRYFNRILSRAPFDGDTTYYLRVKYLQKMYPHYPWKYLKYDYTKKQYSLTIPEEITWTGSIEGESDEAYLLRVYKRKVEETEEEYWTRLLARNKGETDEKYAQRQLKLKALFPELDWSKVQWDQTTRTFIYTTSTTTSFWTKRTDESWEQYYWRLYPVKEGESDEEFVRKLLRRFDGESTEAYQKRIMGMVKNVYVHAPWENISYDISKGLYVYNNRGKINSNLRNTVVNGKEWYITWFRRSGESEDEYCRRVYSKSFSESEEEYLIRILKKFSGESDESYKSRIAKMTTTFVNVPWSNINYDETKGEYVFDGKVPVTSKIRDVSINGKEVDIGDYWSKRQGESEGEYYSRLYPKMSGETGREYLTRLLTRHEGESSAEYMTRIGMLRLVYTHVPWDKINLNQETGQYEISKDTTVGDEVWTVNISREEVDIGDYWSKRQGESEWEYYSRLYPKMSGETGREYLTRLLTRHEGESSAEYMTRIGMLRLVYTHVPWDKINLNQETGQYEISKDTTVGDEVWTVNISGEEKGVGQTSYNIDDNSSSKDTVEHSSSHKSKSTEGQGYNNDQKLDSNQDHSKSRSSKSSSSTTESLESASTISKTDSSSVKDTKNNDENVNETDEEKQKPTSKSSFDKSESDSQSYKTTINIGDSSASGSRSIEDKVSGTEEVSQKSTSQSSKSSKSTATNVESITNRGDESSPGSRSLVKDKESGTEENNHKASSKSELSKSKTTNEESYSTPVKIADDSSPGSRSLVEVKTSETEDNSADKLPTATQISSSTTTTTTSEPSREDNGSGADEDYQRTKSTAGSSQSKTAAEESYSSTVNIVDESSPGSRSLKEIPQSTSKTEHDSLDTSSSPGSTPSYTTTTSAEPSKEVRHEDEKLCKQMYQKQPFETEDSYYKRILEKYDLEDDDNYESRIETVEENFPDLPIWNNKAALKYSKLYYDNKLKRRPGERDVDYGRRVLKRPKNYSDEQYNKMVNFVKEYSNTKNVPIKKERIVGQVINMDCLISKTLSTDEKGLTSTAIPTTTKQPTTTSLPSTASEAEYDIDVLVVEEKSKVSKNFQETSEYKEEKSVTYDSTPTTSTTTTDTPTTTEQPTTTSLPSTTTTTVPTTTEQPTTTSIPSTASDAEYDIDVLVVEEKSKVSKSFEETTEYKEEKSVTYDSTPTTSTTTTDTPTTTEQPTTTFLPSTTTTTIPTTTEQPTTTSLPSTASDAKYDIDVLVVEEKSKVSRSLEETTEYKEEKSVTYDSTPTTSTTTTDTPTTTEQPTTTSLPSTTTTTVPTTTEQPTTTSIPSTASDAEYDIDVLVVEEKSKVSKSFEETTEYKEEKSVTYDSTPTTSTTTTDTPTTTEQPTTTSLPSTTTTTVPTTTEQPTTTSIPSTASDAEYDIDVLVVEEKSKVSRSLEETTEYKEEKSVTYDSTPTTSTTTTDTPTTTEQPTTTFLPSTTTTTIPTTTEQPTTTSIPSTASDAKYDIDVLVVEEKSKVSRSLEETTEYKEEKSVTYDSTPTTSTTTTDTPTTTEQPTTTFLPSTTTTTIPTTTEQLTTTSIPSTASDAKYDIDVLVVEEKSKVSRSLEETTEYKEEKSVTYDSTPTTSTTTTDTPTTTEQPTTTSLPSTTTTTVPTTTEQPTTTSIPSTASDAEYDIDVLVVEEKSKVSKSFEETTEYKEEKSVTYDSTPTTSTTTTDTPTTTEQPTTTSLPSTTTTTVPTTTEQPTTTSIPSTASDAEYDIDVLVVEEKSKVSRSLEETTEYKEEKSVTYDSTPTTSTTTTDTPTTTEQPTTTYLPSTTTTTIPTTTEQPTTTSLPSTASDAEYDIDVLVVEEKSKVSRSLEETSEYKEEKSVSYDSTPTTSTTTTDTPTTTEQPTTTSLPSTTTTTVPTTTEQPTTTSIPSTASDAEYDIDVLVVEEKSKVLKSFEETTEFKEEKSVTYDSTPTTSTTTTDTPTTTEQPTTTSLHSTTTTTVPTTTEQPTTTSLPSTASDAEYDIDVLVVEEKSKVSRSLEETTEYKEEKSVTYDSTPTTSTTTTDTPTTTEQPTTTSLPSTTTTTVPTTTEQPTTTSIPSTASDAEYDIDVLVVEEKSKVSKSFEETTEYKEEKSVTYDSTPTTSTTTTDTPTTTEQPTTTSLPSTTTTTVPTTTEQPTTTSIPSTASDAEYDIDVLVVEEKSKVSRSLEESTEYKEEKSVTYDSTPTTSTTTTATAPVLNEKGVESEYEVEVIEKTTSEKIKTTVEEEEHNSHSVEEQKKPSESVKDYYKRVYKQTPEESIDEYKKRVYSRRPNEGDEDYVERIKTLRILFPNSKVWEDDDDLTYSLEYYKLLYKQKPGEYSTTYYNRLTARGEGEDVEEYKKKILTSYKMYPELPMWKDKKYIDIIEKNSTDDDDKQRPDQSDEDFYKRVYSKKPSENTEEYKKRVYARRKEETDDSYINRINSLRKIFLDSTIWNDDDDLTYSLEYYKLLYKKKEGEDTDSYYSRLLTQLPGESDESYVRRITSIKRAFPDLTLWYEVEYLKHTKKYYLLKFAKQVSETDNDYFVRLLKKEKGENKDNYVKRVQLLSTLFPKLNLWQNAKSLDISRSYYEQLYKQKLGESLDKYYNRIMYQGLTETPDEYVKRISFIQALFPKLDLWHNPKYLIYTSKYFVLLYKQLPEENVNEYYARLFKRKPDESNEEYVKRIQLIYIIMPKLRFIFNNPTYLNYTKDYYEQIYGMKDKEHYDKYLIRVFRQGAKEGNVEFVDKLKVLSAMYPTLPVWNNPKEVRYTRRYYMDVYKRNKGESEDDYYRRLVYQGPTESDEDYLKRMQVIQAVYPKLSLWTDQQYLMYTGKYFTYLYRQNDNEDVDTFRSRIFAKKSGESKEEYVKRVSILRKLFYTEIDNLFDNPDYLNFTRDYYTIQYGQKPGESVDDYVTRTFAQDAEESDFEYVNRIKVVKALFPELEVWNDKEKFESTRHFYEVLYERQPEQSEDDFYKSIFTKGKAETDDAYKARIEIFQMTYPDLPVWNSPEYLIYTRKFYLIQCKKPKSKDDDSFYKPIFQRNVGETNEQYLNRITTYFLVDDSNPIWYDEKYLKYTKPYFTLLFAQKPDETLSAWANRLLKQYSEESDDEYNKRMKIVKAVVSKEVWEKIKSIKAADKTQSVSNTGVFYLDNEIKSDEDIDEAAKKVFAKRDFENYHQYMARILEADSDEKPDHYIERLEWIKKNMPTIGQSDIFKKYYKGKMDSKKDHPILWSFRHKAVHQLDQSKALKEVPIISKRSQVILTSQQPWETRRQYYEKVYRQKEDEDDDDYFKRIFSPKPHESVNHYVKRLVTLHKVFPQLTVWQNNEYMKYVKNVKQEQIDKYQKHKKPSEGKKNNPNASLSSDSSIDD